MNHSILFIPFQHGGIGRITQQLGAAAARSTHAVGEIPREETCASEVGTPVKVSGLEGGILLHTVGEKLDGAQILLHDRCDSLVRTAAVAEIVLHAAEEGYGDEEEEVIPRRVEDVQEQVAVQKAPTKLSPAPVVSTTVTFSSAATQKLPSRLAI